ncbi:hypothetical protein [Marinicellulosiphila megalodicopiae]|uniref:hypothetical protein n=1 Tax=Marinicellulosiphila megalodicopiae TaxID=2724896 RepID=UPI003BAFA1F7
MKSILDIIWNITLICPWDCEFCCTDAVHVSQEKNSIIAREHSLKKTSIITNDLSEKFKALYPNIEPSIFDLTLIDRQEKGIELALEEKINILKNIEGYDVKIDFAGGDPLSCYENFLLIQEASKRFGKENISITSTGYFIKKYGIEKLANIIGEYEFTYDEVHKTQPCTRPKGYNSSNIKIASQFSKFGVKTKAQLPLHEGNLDNNSIQKIYNTLKQYNIDELLIMRTFPVGRGINYLSNNKIDKKTIKSAITNFKKLEDKKNTRIRLQCALKHLIEPTPDNPCDMLRESFGINFRGDLLLSAWANNEHGLPLHDSFILGRIHKESFLDISITPNFIELAKRMNENHGHCKIFSFMNGEKNRNSLFSKTDPLYS